MTLVTCPCCKGETQLAIYEPGMVLAPTFEICCHCQGEGEIEAEEGTVDVPLDLQDRRISTEKRKSVSWLETWRSHFRWRP